VNVNREQRTETAIKPKWYVSGAYDDSQGIALGAVGDACLAIALGIS
jgi:hypothetical protein